MREKIASIVIIGLWRFDGLDKLIVLRMRRSIVICGETDRERERERERETERQRDREQSVMKTVEIN